MRLSIEDGYTLHGQTEATVADPVTNRVLYADLPVVTFSYRPALPVALATYRRAANRAESGEVEVEATAKFLCDHLTAWDVQGRGGAVAPLTAESVKKVPEPILDQIVKAVAHWAPKAEADLGNSAAASGSPS